jgi:hypothetical protein
MANGKRGIHCFCLDTSKKIKGCHIKLMVSLYKNFY